MSITQLTIAIPTFNRPKELRRAVSALIPQLLKHTTVRLLIRDNASTIPAQDAVGDLLTTLGDRARIIRNPVNIGGNANIMRCFENCETQWLWVLGDDDIPRPDALETIFASLTDDLVFAFFDFPQMSIAHHWSGETTLGNDVVSLFSTLKGETTPLSLLSASIYNVTRANKYLTSGYALATSGIPHLIMAYLSIIKENSRWLLSNKSICDYTSQRCSAGSPMYNLLLQAPISILAFTDCPRERLEMVCSIRKVHAKAPEFVLFSTISGNGFKASYFSTECAYLFNMLRGVYDPGWIHPILHLRWMVSMAFSYFPHEFCKSVETALRMISRPQPYEGNANRK